MVPEKRFSVRSRTRVEPDFIGPSDVGHAVHHRFRPGAVIKRERGPVGWRRAGERRAGGHAQIEAEGNNRGRVGHQEGCVGVEGLPPLRVLEQRARGSGG